MSGPPQVCPPALKMPRDHRESVECVSLFIFSPQNLNFASMLHVYAGKGNLFWKITSLRGGTHVHTHANHHSYLMCESKAHSTAIELRASQIINRLPIQAAAVLHRSAFSTWFYFISKMLHWFLQVFSLQGGTTCRGQENLYLRLFISNTIFQANLPLFTLFIHVQGVEQVCTPAFSVIN